MIDLFIRVCFFCCLFLGRGFNRLAHQAFGEKQIEVCLTVHHASYMYVALCYNFDQNALL